MREVKGRLARLHGPTEAVQPKEFNISKSTVEKPQNERPEETVRLSAESNGVPILDTTL